MNESIWTTTNYAFSAEDLAEKLSGTMKATMTHQAASVMKPARCALVAKELVVN
jgi:hypothetical protein